MTLGTSSRAMAITMAGMVLSQPEIPTKASSRWPRTTSSTESAIQSRLISDAFMPSVPIAMPSVTEIVLNSIGVPPAARMPSFTLSAGLRGLELQGVSSIQQWATPTSGRERSSSVNPTARKYVRAAARSAPSRRTRLLWRGSNGMVSLLLGRTLRDEEGDATPLDHLAPLIEHLVGLDDQATVAHVPGLQGPRAQGDRVAHAEGREHLPLDGEERLHGERRAGHAPAESGGETQRQQRGHRAGIIPRVSGHPAVEAHVGLGDGDGRCLAVPAGHHVLEVRPLSRHGAPPSARSRPPARPRRAD